ncbi:hypothetical protein [Pseudoteredinibacter isoporae]|uniref:hypothetical protein n=1 Tax=Pseudoteredinibacter isoporae TaxID=570281 RepID=UPI00334091AF
MNVDDKKATYLYGLTPWGEYEGSHDSSYKKQQIKNFCEEQERYFKENNISTVISKQINVPLAKTYKDCIAADTKGVKIVPSLDGPYNDNVTLTIDSTSDGDFLLYSYKATNYSCEVFGDDYSKKEISPSGDEYALKNPIKIGNANIHISCKRGGRSLSESSEGVVVRYPAARIEVLTSGPRLSVTQEDVYADLYVTPPGSVIAFNGVTCPAGWHPYSKAYGRFIRGIDPTGHADPHGRREAGSHQEDTFKSHNHFLTYRGRGTKKGSSYHGGMRAGHASDKDGEGRLNSSSVGGSETRPKNVALLYCELPAR